MKFIVPFTMDFFFGIDFIFFNGFVQKEMESQNKINILTDQTSKELLSSK